MKFSRFLSALLAIFGLIAYAQTSYAQMYWRVDSGYSWSRDAGIADKNFPLDQGICGNAACTVPGKLNDADDSFILGGGVGYRFDPSLRADFTISYRGGYKVSGVDAGVPATAFSADINSWAYMLNGYYDIPVSGSWKPYVGGGLGYARNKLDSISASVPGVSASLPSGTKSGMAWSLMAGVGYPLSKTMTLDIGYRFMDLGKIESNAGPISPAAFGTYSGATGKLRAHEFTIGLRF